MWDKTLDAYISGGTAVVVTSLYESEAEERQHLSAIDVLARDLGVAEDFIRPLYENELRELKEHARIRNFLSLLVSRRIKEKSTSSSSQV